MIDFENEEALPAGERFRIWARRRERYANDPQHKALRDELAARLERLVKSTSKD